MSAKRAWSQPQTTSTQQKVNHTPMNCIACMHPDVNQGNYLLFCQTAQRKLQALIERHAHPKNAENSCFGQTRVYPLVQMGLFDLHDDELTAPRMCPSL